MTHINTLPQLEALELLYSSTVELKMNNEDTLHIFLSHHQHSSWLSSTRTINSLPNDKILDWSQLKAFADDKLNLAEKFEYVLGRVENIVGKGENAGYQHFLL